MYNNAMRILYKLSKKVFSLLVIYILQLIHTHAHTNTLTLTLKYLIERNLIEKHLNN